jgi:hypothetical protein
MKALTYLVIKEGGDPIPPGTAISKSELLEAGQTEDDIQALLDGGALSEDDDAPLHPDHADLEEEGGVTSHDSGRGR